MRDGQACRDFAGCYQGSIREICVRLLKGFGYKLTEGRRKFMVFAK